MAARRFAAQCDPLTLCAVVVVVVVVVLLSSSFRAVVLAEKAGTRSGIICIMYQCIIFFRQLSIEIQFFFVRVFLSFFLLSITSFCF